MSHRDLEDTGKCRSCFHWSEMCARTDGAGRVLAMCVASPPAPKQLQYLTGDDDCPAYKWGHGQAADDPTLFTPDKKSEKCPHEAECHYEKTKGKNPEAVIAWFGFDAVTCFHCGKPFENPDEDRMHVRTRVCSASTRVEIEAAHEACIEKGKAAALTDVIGAIKEATKKAGLDVTVIR